MKLSEYAAYDGLALAALVKKREISASELMATAYEAVAAVNPRLNFLVADTRQVAESFLAAGVPDGPFAGVPFLLKDIGAGVLGGVPQESGCRLAQGLKPPADDLLTTRYKKAGLVIIGRTTTPELGSSPITEPLIYGPTRNPWNPEHITGGSSGGAAAAVAAGVVPVAQASDGGGSIRIPAACCGLFGLKPSRGRMPDFPSLFSFGVSHVLTRTVRDSAAMLDATQGVLPGCGFRLPPPEQPFRAQIATPPPPLRIALLTQAPFDVQIHPDCLAAVQRTAQWCEELGHHIEPVHLTFDEERSLDALVKAWSLGILFGVRMIEQQTGRKAGPQNLERCNLAFLEIAEALSPLEILQVHQELSNITAKLTTLLDDFDMALTPTLTQPPIKVGSLDANAPDLQGNLWFMRCMQVSAFTAHFNISGQPAMSLPLYWTERQLPVGVQFAAPMGAEGRLLQLAAQLEQAHPWQQRHPCVSVWSPSPGD